MPLPFYTQKYYTQKYKVFVPKRKEMPSPNKEEIESDLFNAIWEVMKDWDINVPEYYSGYTSGNGSHVKLILDSIKKSQRDNKIDYLIDDENR